jgi:hypothetical protein
MATGVLAVTREPVEAYLIDVLTRNSLATVHPQFRRPQVPPPWPTDPVARFAWLVSFPAEPWMPTPAEQDEK